MKLSAICLAGMLAAGATSAFAAQPVGAMHPEESSPDNLPPLASPGPEAEFIKQVQEKLHDRGFDAGPVNGAFGHKTQAALAQFQLATLLPASGALDARTLLELGVERPQID
jgi:peptidoglycan hydrolase-like protein with peptidoglycan-binding domain